LDSATLKMRHMRNIVGQRVKEARKLAKPKITQEQLAVRLQVQDWEIYQVGIAKIEAEVRELTDNELLKLSKALGVSAAWLLGEK
jgi:HTH-type transcriptional regulator, cell division transcriptional repressor